jgi:hypothetical protein
VGKLYGRSRPISIGTSSQLFGDHPSGYKNKTILERLREIASIDLQDYFRFTIHNPVLDLDAAP